MINEVNIERSPIESIYWLSLEERRQKDFSFEATSLPGHLLQYMISGEVDQECDSRRYVLRPGAVIWYHNDEYVRGRVLKAPWRFYSVGFSAPTLAPPPFEARLFQPPKKPTAGLFDRLYRAWHDEGAPAEARKFRTHAALLEILAHLRFPQQSAARADPHMRLWWTIETELRRDLRQPITLARIREIGRRSPATISRSCIASVGMPPMKRMKQVRMSLARGLLKHSDLSVTEIADRVGYARVHEFSRDYRRHFGYPPSGERSV